MICHQHNPTTGGLNRKYFKPYLLSIDCGYQQIFGYLTRASN